MKTTTRPPSRAPFVRAMFGRIAGRYDFMNTLMTGGRHHAWRRLAVRRARPAGGRALDVCCGTGDFALELARQGATAVVGVDFSREMLALAARKAQAVGLGDHVQWQLADALELPFPDGAFLSATTGFSLRNVDDVGRAVNPMIIDGQVHGGIAQGVGQALLEQCFYDSATGQLLSGSFMDYSMPRAHNFPFFATQISEVPSPTHPLGMRPAGEGGTTPALGVVINAVVDALSDFGVRHIEMPATPERVWRAIRGGQTLPPSVSTNR